MAIAGEPARGGRHHDDFPLLLLYGRPRGDPRPERLEPAIRELNRLRGSGVIRHLVHARYEIIEWHHFERFRRLIDACMVNLVSFMNHTPGQGQFRDKETLMAYYVRKYGAQLPDINAIIEERLQKAANPLVEETLERLMGHAKRAGLPMASHDDESPEQVVRMRGRGVSIAEFPIALDAARAAAAHGMHVVIGAPNVLRGQSTSGNLSVREAIGNNTVDVLCSDYYTPAMLHAVFALARDKVLPLHDAVRLVSSNPARAVGLFSELGSLQVGKRADMIMVSEAGGVPTVISAWVGGRRVFEKHDSALRPVGEQWAREAAAVDREASRVS
jgi:alpha-D-ribose 1-methylphosphonate 5-triphosphate diphosphatase